MLFKSLAQFARSGGGALLLIFACIVGTASVAWADHEEGEAWMCPNAKTLMAGQVRTPEDVRAFARCARDFIAAHNDYSLDDFREAFDAPQWKDPDGQGSYIFVNQDKEDGDQVTAQVHPYDESAEGGTLSRIFTSFGDYIKEAHWIINRWSEFAHAEGYVYYEWDNYSTGKKKAPKYSYELRHQDRQDGEGGFPGTIQSDNYLIGAGVYLPELAGPCRADKLNQQASPEKLQDFVRCAARNYADHNGATDAGSIVSSAFVTSSQYRAGSIYTFVVDPSTGMLDWSAQYAAGSGQGVQAGSQPEWRNTSNGMGLPDERKVLPVIKDFGSGFLYYKHINPVSNQIERKVTYAQLIRDARGKEVILAAGYYLPLQGVAQASIDCLSDASNSNFEDNLERYGRNFQNAADIETRDDLQAFVLKAACHVDNVGIQRAKKDFAAPKSHYASSSQHYVGETEWYSHDSGGGMYIFVDEHKQTGPASVLHIYPRDPAQEGRGFADFNDRHGNSYYPEVYRMAELMGREGGWTYYNYPTLEAGGEASPDSNPKPKASYIVTFRAQDGKTYRVGAGIYEAKLPGNCNDITANDLKGLQDSARAEFKKLKFKHNADPGDNRWVNGELINAVQLASQSLRDQATEQLQAFVRCAAQEFERHDSIKEAKKALVTGSNPGAADDNFEARGLTGKWRSTAQIKKIKSRTANNYTERIRVDGSFRYAPIYTFVYDEEGQLVWGRDWAAHSQHLAFDLAQQPRRDRAESLERQREDCNDELESIGLEDHRRRLRKQAECQDIAAEHTEAENLVDGYDENKAPRPITEFEYGLNQHNAAFTRRDRDNNNTLTPIPIPGPRKGQYTLKVLNKFGEAFVYYKINDYNFSALDFPTAGRSNTGDYRGGMENSPTYRFDQNKRSFMKKVSIDGKTYYIGAGLYE